jgi:TP901 family phage tail tape measure protein
MASINLTVNSNTAQAQKDLKEFAMRSEEVRKKVEEYRKSFNPAEIDKFIDKNRRAAAAVTATDGPLKGAQAEQKALRKEIQNLIKNGFDPQSDAIRELTGRYEELTSDIDRAKDEQKRLTNENKKAAAQTRAAQKAQAEANERFKAGIKHLVGMAAAYVSIRQATQFMRSATNDAIEYTKAIANVNTMIEMSSEDFAMLDERLKAISEEYAIQKTELTGGVYQALSAGAKDLSEALEIVEASTILSKGALIENSQSVDIVTTAMNAYGKEVVSARDAIDSYFTIIKQGKITGDQLAADIGKSVTLFASAKLPIEELGAGLATLTKVGVNSSEAMTQLNGIVNAFIKPSEAMTAALNEAGIASGSTLLETQGLAGALEFLQTQTDGNLDKIVELVPNIRGLRGALAAGADDGKVFADILAEFANQSGAADDALKAQTEGFAENAFEIEQARIRLANMREEIGQNILPILASFVNNLDKIALVLSGVTAGLVTFLAVAKGAAIINALKTAFIGLNAAIAANPIGAIAVVATTVLVPALIYLYKNWDTVSVAISEGVAVMRERFLIFASKIREGWIVSINAIKMAFISLGRLIVDKIFSKLQDFFEFLSGVPLIGDMFQGLSDKIGGIGDSFDIAAQAALLSSQSEIRAARKAGEEIRKQSEENITQIHKESEERRKAVEEAQERRKAVEEAQERRKAVEEAQENVPDTTTPPAGIPLPEVGGGDDGVKSLTDRLQALQNVEAIAYEERLSTFRDFLSARMEQEQITGADREQFILDELERIRNLETISEEERQVALAAANQELNNIRTEDAQRAREIVEQKKEDERVAAEERIRIEAQIRDARISIMEEGRERFMAELTLEIDALRQKGLSEIELERYKQDQITDYEKEQLEARKQAYLDTYNEIQSSVSSVWSSLNKIKSNQADAEIASLERVHEDQIKLLEDSGASEEEITKKKGELASDLEQRKKEIARAEAIREKRMNLFTAVTSTAAAIAKALPNLLLAGLAGAMGAAQIAAINSTPIPKAQTGTPIDGYTIPDTGRSAKADRVGVMASPGETVSVTPRGERRQQRTIVQIGERVILDVVKDAIDNGDLIISTENIQGTA